MEAGIASGSTTGAILELFVGWRYLFLGGSTFSVGVLALFGPIIPY
jgi:hypothetical protein